MMKSLLRSPFIYSLLFILPNFAFGQHFFKGYISRDNSKVQGYIHYSTSPSSRNVILFKPTKSGEEEKLTPADIQGFYLEDYGAEYISVNDEKTGTPLFAEVIIKGPATLSNANSLYVLDANNQQLQIQLPVNKYEDGKELGLAEIQRKQIMIIATVKNSLKDCLKENFESSMQRPTKEKLRKVINYYNRCKGQSADKIKRHVNFGVVVGYQLPTIKFKDSRFNYFEGKGSPKVGLELQLPARFSSKASFNLQLLYSQNKFELDKDSPLGDLDIDLDYSSIRLPISIKFYTSPGQIGLFVQSGLSPVILFNGDTNSNLIDLESFSAGALFGIGYDQQIGLHHRLSGSFKFETSIISPYSRASNQINLQFDLSFSF